METEKNRTLSRAGHQQEGECLLHEIILNGFSSVSCVQLEKQLTQSVEEATHERNSKQLLKELLSQQKAYQSTLQEVSGC